MANERHEYSGEPKIQVADAFKPIFFSDCKEFILVGGRAGGKTKTATILAGIVSASIPNSDIVVSRAVDSSMRDSIYQEVKEVFDEQEAFEGLFVYYKNPLRIQRIDGSSVIYFIPSGNSVEQTKGFKPVHKVSLFILEETQQLRSRGHYQQLMASIYRRFGNEVKIVILGNRPDNRYHWFNQLIDEKARDRDCLIIETSWKDISPFLSDLEIREILKLKRRNPQYYEYLYEGKLTTSLGLCYPMFNKDMHVISYNEFRKALPKLYILGVIIGCDGAVANDKTVFAPCLILNTGQIVVADLFVHDPTVDGVFSTVDIVEKFATKWFTILRQKYGLDAFRVPIHFTVDSNATDLYMHIRTFFGSRATCSQVHKKTIPLMVSSVQSAISKDNVYILDFENGYYSFARNKYVSKLESPHPLVEELEKLTYDEKNPNRYNPSIPNDCVDALTYAVLDIYSNPQNLHFLTLAKQRRKNFSSLKEILQKLKNVS